MPTLKHYSRATGLILTIDVRSCRAPCYLAEGGYFITLKEGRLSCAMVAVSGVLWRGGGRSVSEGGCVLQIAKERIAEQHIRNNK